MESKNVIIFQSAEQFQAAIRDEVMKCLAKLEPRARVEPAGLTTKQVMVKFGLESPQTVLNWEKQGKIKRVLPQKGRRALWLSEN
jgi:hypothetical protein